jgi:polygalacturonase
MKTNKLQEQVFSGSIDRRTFLGNAISVALGTALLPMAGCVTEEVADPWQLAEEIRNRIQAPEFPDRDFLVTEFGARADDKTDCTKSINDAIQTCAEAGGGRVVIPAGTFQTGPIHLLSNVNLHVTENATLSFYADPEKYLPLVFTRFEGTECMNFSPLVYAFEQENIAVTGGGTLDGNADYDNWWIWKKSREGEKQPNPSIKQLTEMGDAGIPPEKRIFGTEGRLRPCFIEPYRCRNVLIEDVRLRRAPFWQIHPVLSTNVTVRGVDVNSHGPNNDGCNPESCRDVLIENSFFDTGDDCIAIKSGRNTDGRRVNVPSENIVVSDCEMRAGHGGVVIGSEMSGGVRNVFAENCQMSSPDLWYMLRIKTNSLRGGFVENVHVRKVKIGTVGIAAVRVNFHYSDGDVGDFVPRVSNVSVSDVEGADVRQVLFLQGYERSPVQDIRISNSRFEGVKEADVVEHVDGLVLDNVYTDL